MKYKFIVFITFVALIITSSLAQETNKTGIVSVTKDFSGKVTAIKLIVNSYDIKLDEHSKQLESMADQKVRVTHDALFIEGLLPVTSVELIKGSDSPVASPSD